jgi:hypothetical protein
MRKLGVEAPGAVVRYVETAVVQGSEPAVIPADDEPLERAA